MKAFLASAFIATASAALQANQAVSVYTFERFETEYNRTYSSFEEREYRRSIFQQNIAEIMRLNESIESAEFSINDFADKTMDEISTFMGRKNASPDIPVKLTSSTTPISELPTSVDWRTRGAITEVRSQGRCGSCWAFGAVATIESYHAIANGELRTLSPQQVVDCVGNPRHCGGTGGCEGGIEELAFEYAKTQGLVDDSAYTYEAKQGKCRVEQTAEAVQRDAVKVAGWAKLPTNDYSAVLRHIAEEGPLSISVAASGFAFYSKGVFTGCPKGKENVALNHAVQLVGYGTDEATGLDYWLIRNSWGAQWGEEGYIRVWRNKPTDEGFCGVCSTPEDNAWCEDEPLEPMTVCGHCGVVFETSFVIPYTNAEAEAVERI